MAGLMTAFRFTALYIGYTDGSDVTSALTRVTSGYSQTGSTKTVATDWYAR